MLQLASLKKLSSTLAHGFTLKTEGDFNSDSPNFPETLSSLCREQKLPHTPKFLQQIHGKAVIRIDSPNQETGEGDALITDQPDLPLMVKVADCQGIIAYEPRQSCLGAIHSGWRGSVQNIIGATLERMRKEYGCDPAQIWIGIGPSLGPCCAEFSDPEKELPDFCRPFVQGRKVNFWNLSKEQCEQAGVPAEQIEIAGICTRCQPGFFSHRRGDSGRSMNWAMIKTESGVYNGLATLKL